MIATNLRPKSLKLASKEGKISKRSIIIGENLDGEVTPNNKDWRIVLPWLEAGGALGVKVVARGWSDSVAFRLA